MCDDCTGIRYCAYDHSDSKYFGSGKKGVSGEKVDCRLEVAPETTRVKNVYGALVAPDAQFLFVWSK